MIIVECYVDEALLESLGFHDIRHEENKAAVIEEMRRRAGCAKAVGLLDEDPGCPWPRYWRGFRRARNSQHGFSTWDGPGDAHAVVLSLNHEVWIYNAARRCHIDVRSHGLPPDWRDFHSRLHGGRRTRVRTLLSYRRLLEDMLNKGCRALLDLKNELNRLLKQP